MPIRVKPAPDLERKHGAGSYVPGIGTGTELPNAQAERLIKAGLVVRDEPDEKPAPAGSAKAEKE
jgi:hypothetical protein